MIKGQAVIGEFVKVIDRNNASVQIKLIKSDILVFKDNKFGISARYISEVEYTGAKTIWETYTEAEIKYNISKLRLRIIKLNKKLINFEKELVRRIK